MDPQMDPEMDLVILILGDPCKKRPSIIPYPIQGEGQKHMHSTFSSKYCKKAAIDDYFNGV